MSKGKHHYVPKLYLKRFASKPRRINIHILHSNEFHQDVSLKDQCQRPRFYGKTDEVENDLMKLEGIVGPALANIVKQSTVPGADSVERAHLLLFAAFQNSRTPMAAAAMTEGFNKVIDLVRPKNANDDLNRDSHRMSFEFALRESLRNAGLVAQCWSDLEIHLILNESGHGFITCDNPAVLYNKYCEGLKGFGTTGAAKRGLQVFLPLSPHHLVLFYDRHVYKVGTRNSNMTRLFAYQDVRSINLLQAVNADEVLLFSDWKDVHELRKLVIHSKKYRREQASEVEEFVAEDNEENESLLKLYPIPLDVKLDLSFVNLRRKAQGVPRRQRALEYRDHDRMYDFEDIRRRGLASSSRRFVRKDLVQH